MLKKIRQIILLQIIIVISLFVATPIRAVCPVCTIAVGAGLGISRALGIDDAVTSVWIGGLILSMSFWLIDWLNKKRGFTQKSGYRLLIIVLMYLITLLPLYFTKYIGRLYNSIFGIDKIIFGTFCGSLTFMAAKWSDEKVRRVKGKQLFIYQRVIFPLISLIITSVALHFLIP